MSKHVDHRRQSDADAQNNGGMPSSDDQVSNNLSATVDVEMNSTDNRPRSEDEKKEAREWKLQNEQRRAKIWQAETVTVMQPQCRTVPNGGALENKVYNAEQQSTSSSPSRLNSFLTEKSRIANRSLRRMSSRLSQLSSSQNSYESTGTAVSEKHAIATRSQRRIDAREAARNHPYQKNESMELIPHRTKAGTAELILQTVTENPREYSNQRNCNATPPEPETWCASTYAGDLVRAVAVDCEEGGDDCFVSDIPYAAEVVNQEGVAFRKLPVLVCLALICLVAINIGVVFAVIQNKGQPVAATDTIPGSDTQSQVKFPTEQSVSSPPTGHPTFSNEGRPPIPSSSNASSKSRTKAPSTIDENNQPISTIPAGSAPSRSPSLEPSHALPYATFSPSLRPVTESPSPSPSTEMPSSSQPTTSILPSSSEPTHRSSSGPTRTYLFNPIVVIGGYRPSLSTEVIGEFTTQHPTSNR